MKKVKNSFADSLKEVLEKSLGVKSKPHVANKNGFVFTARGKVCFDEIFDLTAKYCGDENYCTSVRGIKNALGSDHFAGIFASKNEQAHLINITGEEGAVAVEIF